MAYTALKSVQSWPVKMSRTLSSMIMPESPDSKIIIRKSMLILQGWRFISDMLVRQWRIPQKGFQSLQAILTVTIAL